AQGRCARPWCPGTWGSAYGTGEGSRDVTGAASAGRAAGEPPATRRRRRDHRHGPAHPTARDIAPRAHPRRPGCSLPLAGCPSGRRRAGTDRFGRHADARRPDRLPAQRRGTTAQHRTPGTAAPTAAHLPRPRPARHGTGAARTGLLRGSRRTRILGRARSPAARPGRTAAPPAGRDRYPAAAGPHLGPGHGGLRLREPPAAQPHAEPVRAAPGRGERPDQPGPDRGRYRRLVRRKRRTTVVTALAA